MALIKRLRPSQPDPTPAPAIDAASGMSNAQVATLSLLQLEAIRVFRTLKGRSWKAELNSCWSRASYPGLGAQHAAVLQQIRNEFGPEWLQKFSVSQQQDALYKAAQEALQIEEHLRHDSNATPEQISSAKDDRKLAEGAAMLWERGDSRQFSADGPAVHLNMSSDISVPSPSPASTPIEEPVDPLDAATAPGRRKGGGTEKRMKHERGAPRDHYQEVTDQIISAIEAGTEPWRCEWDNTPRWPMNPVTGNPYHGINVMLLLSQGYQENRWCSYKTAQAQGWQVRGGESGSKIYFYKRLTKETGELSATGEPEVRVIPLLRSYSVFNLAQMDGAPELESTGRGVKLLSSETRDICEEIIEACGADIVHGFRRAGYSPSEDRIYMPDRESFSSDAEYYTTLLHELAHWSGHESRLAREFGPSRDSDEYAREELRAEMASAMMAMRLALPGSVDGHAGYVDHYLQVLRNDKKEIFRASRDAERMARYVLSFHPDFREEFEQEHRNQMTAAVAAGAPDDIFDASDFDFEPDLELEGPRP
ncbi:antirestriction protein [Pseudomonas aeruginosa]|jgi:antirestriction protein ArdC|uniref:ArdC family protein n=1 Tax=Pseudomonas aeruginosa group TaxID=136841 RepID=UPI00053EFC25|nr:zincin-like metallopeptidase domain-containing protein [Pseudomonas aeruginosa]AKG03115.1 antirestriction protein [Pseudomonas aeruginosa]AZM87025.1 DUF1738 domain-containing protein [Pseudomonas aeruginosa]EIU2680112.1 DUF1738 domain-containing protein [Pseudomonas aeruginosa]EKJ7646834.1 DUF1738 domain-containing protein [Pseudomonas aeruginosa]EKU4432890.1 DUF1738 domain-containing protein [Pseudomonas aeruginosa]